MSSTREQVEWNAELVRGDLGKPLQQHKRASGKGLLEGGVKSAADIASHTQRGGPALSGSETSGLLMVQRRLETPVSVTQYCA